MSYSKNSSGNIQKGAGSRSTSGGGKSLNDGARAPKTRPPQPPKR
ncbi:MAG: hypothetical protein Q4F83_15290 [Eubacteriales bacterium]|nr:hypothetical protein [Eubacteriales bacterium]